MGADDCSIRTVADTLADDSAQLVAAHQQGQLTPMDVDRAARMAREAGAAFIAERKHHEPAMGALSNLAAILANAGRLDELAPHALGALAHPSDWPGRDAAWKDLVYNALFGSMDRTPPERVLPVLNLARRGALTGAPALARFQTLASATRDAGKALANAGRWDLWTQLAEFIAEAPPPLPRLPELPGRALLDACAAMLTDAVVIAISRKELDRAQQLVANLRAMLAAHPDVLVAAQHAVALECLLDANNPEPFLAAEGVGQLVDEQLALVAQWPTERELARALTSTASTAWLLLNAAKDAVRQERLWTGLAGLTTPFPGDEELHFNTARAVVNAAIVRAKEIEPAGFIERIGRLFAPTDPVLDRLEATLQTLIATCRGSAQLADARERFQRVTGRKLLPPKWTLPAPAPLHPDVARLREAFAKEPVDDAAITAVIGTGGYLPRATLEGSGIYAREERYFVTLLEEINKQVASDPARYWKGRQVQLEAITRRLIEDGTETIAQAAGSVRALFRMPPLRRRPPVSENPQHEHVHGENCSH